MPPSTSDQDRVVDGCSSESQPDYSSVDIPAKPPSDYHYTQRRAEILQLIRQAGHPRAINQNELAERYDVSQQQISKDLDRLAEHISEGLGERRELVTDAVFHRAINGLLEEEEWRDAARTVKEWNDWLTEYKDLQEMRERLDRLEEHRGDS